MFQEKQKPGQFLYSLHKVLSTGWNWEDFWYPFLDVEREESKMTIDQADIHYNRKLQIKMAANGYCLNVLDAQGPAGVSAEFERECAAGWKFVKAPDAVV